MRIAQEFGAQPTIENAPAMVEQVETANERQFLDFEKNKVQEVTLDQLSRTIKENRSDDNTPMHGIYHYQLIQQLIDMCNEAGYDTEVYDIFATNNRDKMTPGVTLNPELENDYGKRAVEAHTLRRIFANIRIKNFDDGETTTNLALAYTQKGIQLGIGTKVKACRNQNLLGEGCFVSDYTTNFRYAQGEVGKMTLQQMMQAVGSWLSNLEGIVVTERKTIERMKQVVISDEDIYKIIGLLMTMRVAHDTTVKRIKNRYSVYPLNQTQLGRFTENLLIKKHDEGRITAWGMYNAATELYKATSCKADSIMTQNLAFSKFMLDNQVF